MAKVREIRRRIKSVDNTKQITRAMEMVATSKIKKAQAKIEGLRPYSNKLKGVLSSLIASDSSINDPLIEQRDKVENIALISVTADRGLCGAFNSSILKMTEKYIDGKASESVNVRLITIGKKALGYFKYTGRDLYKSYVGISDSPSIDDAKEITDFIVGLFLEKKVDKVVVIYNRFCSAMEQKPSIDEILPIKAEFEDNEERDEEYIIEPSSREIFSGILKTHLETAVFKVLVDSAASEHAARRKAMKAATDNAQEMIENLTRFYNRARQALITQEISEIVGGAEALEHS